MVDKKNIEEKLFDYFEGELGSSEKLELEQFVQENPEFKSDFDAWEKSYLPQEEFTYDRLDELLVDESSGKSALFGRWKTGLLMLLVGTGLSFGVFHKINGSHSRSTLDAQLDNIQESNTELASAEESNSSVLSGEKDSSEPSLTSQEESSTEDKDQQRKLTTGSPAVALSMHNTAAQTGGSAAGNVVPGKLIAQPKSTNAVAINKVQNNNTINDLLVNQLSKSNFKNIDVGIETSGVSELMSTPKMRKSRSGFKKYDKNVVKFQNEKDPFILLPNGIALGINPSFAGNGKGIRLNYNYNYEWPELNNNYNTHLLSIDTYVKALRGGVGVVVASDVLGHNKFGTKGAELIYSPKFTLFGKTTVEPSVKYGHYQKSIAWGQLKSNQLVDARTGSLNVQVKDEDNEVASSSANYSNLGFGLLLNTSKLYVGFAFDQLLNAQYDFDGISETVDVAGKLTAQVGGSVIPFKDLDYLILSPSLHFIKVGGYDKVWLSNVIEVSRLFAGTSYSFNNEYLFSLGYNNDILRVSYSYGKTKSMLDPSAKNLSLHQVGVVFNFVPQRR